MIKDKGSDEMSRKLRQCIFMFLLLLLLVFRGYGETYSVGPMKVYEITFKPQCYYLSPFNDGKIWLNNGILQEFDPTTGKISDLTTLLGDFATGIMCGSVYNDPHDANLVLIGNLSKGLLVHDKARNTSRKYLKDSYFNGAGISVLRPEKESIWIGTSNGLYRLNRADWKNKGQANFSNEIRGDFFPNP
ncbi:MAG TPA: hypothetical protein VK186_25900 [Candidatus Deferrimicrobium sp.]|nr:hypothetical protein [Candidatus Kapabacteria bacterium]HLP62301.1 hypothetical protein [Candidatus Deferrimicrobium sp.]